ncbi:hypothetical protein LX36DRAFT_737448, partial [Colletotrichum falcatum]
LVTPHAHDATRYDVATRCQRFQKIVDSHLVRGRALCPASLYLECVAMAVKLAQGPETDIWPPKGTEIVFVDVAFENMLGSGLDREVFIRLDPHTEKQQSWAFTFMSTWANGTVSQKARHVKHANGTVAVVTSSDRSFEKVDEKVVRGNMYVLDPNDSRVVAVILGAQFNKIPLKVTESLLERLEPASKDIAGPGTPLPTPNRIPQPVPREPQHRERDIKVLKSTTRALELIASEDKNLQSDKASRSLKSLLSTLIANRADTRATMYIRAIILLANNYSRFAILCRNSKYCSLEGSENKKKSLKLHFDEDKEKVKKHYLYEGLYNEIQIKETLGNPALGTLHISKHPADLTPLPLKILPKST